MNETTSQDGQWRIREAVGNFVVSTKQIAGTSEYTTGVKHKDEPKHDGYIEVNRASNLRTDAIHAHNVAVATIKVVLEKQAAR